MRSIAALSALAALAACATAPPPAGALSGRLSLQIQATASQPARSISATFDLRGNAERGQLQLSTPLGTTLAEASWTPGEARLATPQGEQRFADLEQLSRQAFGELLPLRALPDWLRGRPWSAAPQQGLQPGPGFEQLGWTIDLAEFDSGRLSARRAAPPELRLRVQLDAAP